MSAQDITVIPVRTARQLRRFARFNVQLYKNHPYAVPDLIRDTINTFRPSRNAAFVFCEAQPFIALKDGKVVGRVAAIINTKANEVWNVKTVRFGWIDFIDDIEVSKALLDTVASWGRERGMDRIEGPFGFTDFDPEGMLTDGFDMIGTMATIYNYPYYPEHMARLGFEPSAKWAERQVPYQGAPEKMSRLSQIVLDRYNLHVAKFEHSKNTEARIYARKLFHLVNESFAFLSCSSRCTWPRWTPSKNPIVAAYLLSSGTGMVISISFGVTKVIKIDGPAEFFASKLCNFTLMEYFCTRMKMSVTADDSFSGLLAQLVRATDS